MEHWSAKETLQRSEHKNTTTAHVIVPVSPEQEPKPVPRSKQVSKRAAGIGPAIIPTNEEEEEGAKIKRRRTKPKEGALPLAVGTAPTTPVVEKKKNKPARARVKSNLNTIPIVLKTSTTLSNEDGTQDSKKATVPITPSTASHKMTKADRSHSAGFNQMTQTVIKEFKTVRIPKPGML